MMKDHIKCSSCGYENPPGTQLCQSCGKMINENYDRKKIKDLMRYDGSAIRSKVRSRSISDKIWIFFTSIKVGVVIIVLLSIAAAIGTIFPQEYFIPVGADPSEYYYDNYGSLGYLYYTLGFHNLYSSWWFILLNGLLALSIIAASIDRGVPLFKSLHKQRPKKHETFYKRQRLSLKSDYTLNKDSIIQDFKQKRYKVSQDGEYYLFEKGRLSRYGPYINHLGLIILLAGSMLRFFPGMYVDEIVYLNEGDTRAIPTTNNEYYVENVRYIMEEHDAEDNEVFSEALSNNVIVSNFQTDINFYKNENVDVVGSSPDLVKIDEASIQVNHPYRFDNYELYQSSFDDSQLKSMTFKIENEDGHEVGAPFIVDLNEPNESYDIGEGITVNMQAYAPDFSEISPGGALISETPVPRNPAFVFEVTDGETSEMSLIQIMNSQNITQNNQYSVRFVEAENQMATVLTLKKDLTLPLIAGGFIIFLIGLAIGSYVNHRRIWMCFNNGVVLGAHTNKNYFGFKKEINTILESHGLNHLVDSEELKEASNKENING